MTAELDDVPFSVVRRGYDRAQVEDRLSRLTAELDAVAAERAAAVDDVRTLTRQRDSSHSETQAARTATTEAQTELERLRAQVTELSVIPHTVNGMSERLQQMVRIAQDEVNDMRSRATASAAQILTMAQAEAEELRERSYVERHEFEAERRTAEESLHSQLEESQSRLDQLRRDSDGQMARLDAELADRRARAEQGLAAEMDDRRRGMHSELAAQEARHREEATQILDAANLDARTRLAEATTEAQRIRAESRNDVVAAQRELEELRALQHQISEQLTSVRALLDWTLPRIGSGSKRSSGQDDAPPAAPAPIAPPPIASAPAAEPAEAAPRKPMDQTGERLGRAEDSTEDAEPEPPAPPGSYSSSDTASSDTGESTAATLPSQGDATPPDRPTPLSRHSQVATQAGRAGAHR